jgi:hypothetical protein
MKDEVDFFNPMILVVGILAFLAMGYIGSFNYRFEDPLKLEVILTVAFACIVFIVGYLISTKKVKTMVYLILKEVLMLKCMNLLENLI